MSARCVYCDEDLSGHVCYSCLAEIKQELARLSLQVEVLAQQLRALRTDPAALGTPDTPQTPGAKPSTIQVSGTQAPALRDLIRRAV